MSELLGSRYFLKDLSRTSIEVTYVLGVAKAAVIIAAIANLDERLHGCILLVWEPLVMPPDEAVLEGCPLSAA